MIYLDSSALLKLVRAEAGNAALREWLALHHEQPLVSSVVGRAEVLCAPDESGVRVQAEARVLLGQLDLIPLDRAAQDLASDIGGPLQRILPCISPRPYSSMST